MSIHVGINGFGRIGRIVRFPTLYLLLWWANLFLWTGLQKCFAQQERCHQGYQ
jgi:hypothetical protein